MDCISKMLFVDTVFRSHSTRLKIMPSLEIWQYFVTWTWTVFSGHKTRERNSQFVYTAGPFYQSCPVLRLAGMSTPLKSTAPHNWLNDTALKASHVVFQLTNKCCLVFGEAACSTASASGCVIFYGNFPSGILTNCWSHTQNKQQLVLVLKVSIL